MPTANALSYTRIGLTRFSVPLRLELPYLDTSYRRYPDLRPSLSAILARMLATGRAELDTDDDRALRADWEQQRTETERRLRFNPIETALAAGILVHRTGADGAGFRIPFQRLREQMLFQHLLEQDPAIRPESLADWLALSHSQDLEGALAHVAGVLWDRGRFAELAPLIGESEVPRRAWERMLAVRLVGDVPPTAGQLRALADGLADDLARYRLAYSLIWDVPDRVEGLAAESRRLVLFEMARAILTPLHEREPQRSDLARDLIWSYRFLGQAHHAQGDARQALERYGESLALAGDWLARLRAAGALGPNDDLDIAYLTLLAAAAESLSAGAAPLGWTVGPLDERPDWRPAPLIPGDWQAVSAGDGPAREQTGRSLARLESALARLGLDLTGARVQGLRRLALPFHAGPGGRAGSSRRSRSSTADARPRWPCWKARPASSR